MVAVASCENVTHRYSTQERPVLDRVSFQFRQGEATALLGRNGAGKTTFVNILVGLLAAESGEVRRAKRIGLVSQNPLLDPDLTVGETATLLRRILGSKNSEVDELFAALELSQWINHRVGTLSAGLQRRLDLALGILHAPELIVLDEPTVGLDVQSRSAFWHVIRQQLATSAVLFTTQQLEDIGRWVDHIVLLHNGAFFELKAEDLTHESWRVAAIMNQGETHSEDVATFSDATAAAARIEQNGGAVTEIRRITLEQWFLDITGDSITDEGRHRSVPSLLRR